VKGREKTKDKAHKNKEYRQKSGLLCEAQLHRLHW